MIIYQKIFQKHGFSATQDEILKLVGKDKVLLEVGSSSGYMTEALLNQGCIVDVVEINDEALSKLPNSVRRILNYSIEDDNIFPKLAKDYDFAVMADVLEHLVNPQKALKILYKIASKKTRLIISMPNIASWVMRKQLFFKGDFEYQESGLLDKTHLHFYTVKTLPKLFLSSGWKIEKMIGTLTRLPLEGTINKFPVVRELFKKFLYKKLVEKYKNLSYYHFLVVAYK